VRPASKPSILFVDDEPQVLDGLRDLLRSRRRELHTEFADSGAAALELLAGASFDVVVSDMRMPGMDGAQLLERVRDDHAHAVRVILSGQASEDAVLRMVPVAHISLAKPCTARQLSQMIDRAVAIGGMLEDPVLLAAVHQIGALPSPPAVARRLLEAVADDDTSAAALASIVEGDVALGAKVLQLVNSGFFGLANEITDLQRAIALLGIDVLKTLATFNGVVEELAPAGDAPGFSLDAFERHCGHVARIAAGLCPDREDARTATSAGLLHDIGTLVLASRAPDRLAAVLELSAREQIPVHEAEHALIGVSHATIGGYLLALWGLPPTVVEAVIHHHETPAPWAGPTPASVTDAVRIAVLVCACQTSATPREADLGAIAAATLARVAPPAVVEGWLELAQEAH
jgi:putative nucleotidyltransferase with HDIG domain